MKNKQDRWRQFLSSPYLVVGPVSILGQVVEARLKAANLFPQPAGFWAFLGVELLYWFLVGLVMVLLAVLIHWPKAKRLYREEREYRAKAKRGMSESVADSNIHGTD